MLAQNFQALLYLFQPESLLILLGATAAGVTIGAIPGIPVTLALAIFFGATAAMPFDIALIILMGIFIGTVYGGSIAAVLLNIPGTPSAAATVLDGHPLALQGKAIYAISLARGASVIGTAFGALAMLLLTPFLAHFAMQFTSPEFFSFALFGIMICGSISQKDFVIKGWIGGMLGVLVSCIGLDEIEGVAKFTFGISDLFSGVSLVPVLIGLYAIPEILHSYARSAAPARKAPPDQAVQLSLWKLLPKKIRLIMQSAAIGLGLGVLPGIGEDIAAWTAYDLAKKTSATPEKFGTGCEDGVIAPEVANNTSIIGAIIPILTLGIPGSGPAAILLGAFLLNGIHPGPMLLIDQPAILPQMIVLISLADIALLFSAVLLIRPIMLILKIPQWYLMPVIAAISIIGVFAINLSYFDFIVMFVAAGIGYLLRMMHYSAAPIVLGLILGKMIDIKLRTSLMVSDGSLAIFFTRPISCLFMIIVGFIVIRGLCGQRTTAMPR